MCVLTKPFTMQTLTNRIRSIITERRSRGYTLYDLRSGAQVARFRPTGTDSRFEVLYGSLWKERWPPPVRSDALFYQSMTR
jgi:hypothetical protein